MSLKACPCWSTSLRVRYLPKVPQPSKAVRTSWDPVQTCEPIGIFHKQNIAHPTFIHISFIHPIISGIFSTIGAVHIRTNPICFCLYSESHLPVVFRTECHCDMGRVRHHFHFPPRILPALCCYLESCFRKTVIVIANTSVPSFQTTKYLPMFSNERNPEFGTMLDNIKANK